MLVIARPTGPAAGQPGPAPAGHPVRLRRLRHQHGPGLLGRRSWPGWRPAGCTRSPRCAAAVRKARTGTGRACASTSRTCSTTSTRRRRRSSPTAGPRPGSWASPAARTAGCWSARPSPSGRTCYRGGGVLGPAARHGPLRAVRARPDLERRVRHGRRPGGAGLAARLLALPPRARPGTRYPATLFTVFDNDTRVDPVHAWKMCAALQQATAARWPDRPVLLRREARGRPRRPRGQPFGARCPRTCWPSSPSTPGSAGDQRLPVVPHGREVAVLGRHRLTQRPGRAQHQPGRCWLGSRTVPDTRVARYGQLSRCSRPLWERPRAAPPDL